MCSAEVSVGEQRRTLSLQVDTGTTISLLSLPFARSHFKDFKVKATTTKLYGVGRTTLEVVDALPANVTVNDRQANTEFYIVKTVATKAIMGLDLMSQLGLPIHPATEGVFS